MDTLYLMDAQTRERAKNAKIISIVALVFSGVYVIEGIFSVVFSIIPIPIIGFFISVVLTVVEFCLLIGSIIFMSCALIKSLKIKKELVTIADCQELKEAKADAKLAQILSYVSIGITAVAFCVLSVLNIIELVLSII